MSEGDAAPPTTQQQLQQKLQSTQQQDRRPSSADRASSSSSVKRRVLQESLDLVLPDDRLSPSLPIASELRHRHVHGHHDSDHRHHNEVSGQETPAAAACAAGPPPSLLAQHPASGWSYPCAAAVVIVSALSASLAETYATQHTVVRVWVYGWITALSTALGIVPFVFVQRIPDAQLGVANAVAAGMMLSAALFLFAEGSVGDHTSGKDYLFAHAITSHPARVLLGFVSGVLFIQATQRLVDGSGDFHLGALMGGNAKKAFLVIVVMTLHSMAEGVGIGVSFSGVRGRALGKFISLSLAVHNIPEGLAVALPLIPKGVHKLDAALWSILTSLPQPIVAVLAYVFTEQFEPLLPVGLGFAAGGMFYVACYDMLTEAMEQIRIANALLVISIAFLAMLGIQEALSYV